jgi:hypothetical protein
MRRVPTCVGGTPRPLRQQSLLEFHLELAHLIFQRTERRVSGDAAW